MVAASVYWDSFGVSRQSGPTFICKIIICCSSCHSRPVLTKQTVCIWCLFAASSGWIRGIREFQPHFHLALVIRKTLKEECGDAFMPLPAQKESDSPRVWRWPFEQNEVSFFCTAFEETNKFCCVCVYTGIFLIFICFRKKKKQLLTSCSSSAASGDKNHSVVSEADLCSLNRFTWTICLKNPHSLNGAAWAADKNFPEPF